MKENKANINPRIIIIQKLYSYHLNKEADLLDAAVQKVLDDGLRTKDIMSDGKKEVTTTDMGDAIISKLK